MRGKFEIAHVHEDPPESGALRRFDYAMLARHGKSTLEGRKEHEETSP